MSLIKKNTFYDILYFKALNWRLRTRRNYVLVQKRKEMGISVIPECAMFHCLHLLGIYS